MRVSKRASAVALGAAVALVAAGCGSGDSGGDSPAKTDGAIVIDGSQPEVGLVPANTTETGGGAIIDYLWTGLVEYPNEQGANPKLAVAESIDTKDSKVYTIKIKKGTKFHDGTEVKAESFVKAWNWSAYSPNGAQNSSFFSDIQGFEDVQSVDPDDDGPKKAPEPKAKEMSGLKVVDDHTFEVTLGSPFSIFPTKLGYSAFYPMPDAFFTQGADAFGKKPIGNGPWKFVSWQDNVEIKLTRNDDYTAGDKGKIKDVTVKLYQDAGAAYNDLQAGNLDFQQQVPTSALAGAKYKTDLSDRYIDVPNAATALIAFPFYDKRFQNADLRRAVSLAVDRQSISDKIFSGSRKPADSWANPLTPGAKSGNCTSCSYNPEEAKALLAKAGGFQGEMVFYYNADASHKEWMEAVAQSVKNTLGIEARAEGVPTFAVFRQQINAKQMKGPYRAAWSQDYPDVENWIGPLYVTGGSSNDGSYSNPEVDRLYKEATSAPTVDAAHAKFAEAVTFVDKDTPSIPIYFYGQQSGFSDKIKKPELNVKGEIDLESVELK
ncbi:peptide ABC transporter substrate-binding protein [Micromonospora echinofusca]|uniref:ABC transporter substrate-binding protein n=1 Tax=Micromonospora echinofusca TaxID=47858 RepID=A0ABS3VVG4_MICEH|nr:ABC transporter substrate-binding protein [Micromonospora echinofusca]MBO4208383.1 ABC transporter substrate-binding protein [Micromonospora echinofusca]